jgi:hypothetical protein
MGGASQLLIRVVRVPDFRPMDGFEASLHKYVAP